jgi:hypothetical protein
MTQAQTSPASRRTPGMTHDRFYREHFLPEHQHRGNVALHVAGTVAGLLWLPYSLLTAWPALVLLFPLVHALPGLLGHRLWERDAKVGDVRVTRKDFPAWWFIVANHRLSWDLLCGRRPWAAVVQAPVRHPPGP